MKTLEMVKKQYKSQTLDNRDLHRLVQFLSIEEFKDFGLKPTEEAKKSHVPNPFTKENILKQLKEDVAFGFEKALDKRGISSGLMVEVVMMWNWILEDGLEGLNTSTLYAQYGLPIFKVTALKYGFPNPIGTDVGNESRYSSEGEMEFAYNDWNIKVCEELLKVGIVSERLSSLRIPWYELYKMHLPPEQVVGCIKSQYHDQLKALGLLELFP